MRRRRPIRSALFLAILTVLLGTVHGAVTLTPAAAANCVFEGVSYAPGRIIYWEDDILECQENGRWKLIGSVGPRNFRYFNNGHSGLCLSTAFGSAGEGTPVNQWNCNNQHYQWWAATLNVGGYSQVVNYHSGKCLGTAGGSAAAGAALVIKGCHTATAFTLDQWWRKEPGFNGKTVFRNALSGQVMGIAGGSLELGAPAVQWPLQSRTSDQTWGFRPVIEP